MNSLLPDAGSSFQDPDLRVVPVFVLAFICPFVQSDYLPFKNQGGWVIIRQEEGRRIGYSINLKPALEGKETRTFYLQPKDIVYVPRTQIVLGHKRIEPA